MSRDLTVLVSNWWQPVAWMALIFFFSTDLFSGSNTGSFFAPLLSSVLPTLSEEQIDILHYLLRKLGHWSEYFVLALLFARALRSEFPRRSRLTYFASALILAALYAASDEWHQSFSTARSASVTDVLLDCFGAACGGLWFCRRRTTGLR